MSGIRRWLRGRVLWRRPWVWPWHYFFDCPALTKRIGPGYVRWRCRCGYQTITKTEAA